jgi:pimeloyl-ACP methyl ester carboxylesterase
MLPTREGLIAMPGNRRVAWSAAGPRDGTPVVYVHGGIGTPIQRAPQLDDVISRLRIRHVTINRPGFSGSDPQPGRRITDFPRDLERLADHLGIDRMALVGVSSGGPYALASALALGDRISAVGVVSCLAPTSAPHACRAMPLHVRLGLRTVIRRPEFVERWGERAIGLLERHQERAMRLAMLGASRADRNTLACEQKRAAAMSSFLEAAAGGVRGMLQDYALCCGPWGFDVGAIDREVYLWHGADDDFVPLEHARALAQALPHCRATIGTDDGHFFYRRRMTEVLETLVAAAERVPEPLISVLAA